MKVGDLIADKEFPNEAGTIIHIEEDRNDANTYGVLTPFGKLEWFSKQYIENDCEVISESR